MQEKLEHWYDSDEELAQMAPPLPSYLLSEEPPPRPDPEYLKRSHNQLTREFLALGANFGFPLNFLERLRIANPDWIPDLSHEQIRGCGRDDRAPFFDLHNAILVGVRFQNMDFRNADLSEADLRGAQFINVIFADQSIGANLTGVITDHNTKGLPPLT